MKGYKEYLRELFGFGKPKQSSLAKEIIQYFIDRVNVEFEPLEDVEGNQIGVQGKDEHRFYQVIDDVDGGVEVDINKGDWTFKAKNFKEFWNKLHQYFDDEQ